MVPWLENNFEYIFDFLFQGWARCFYSYSLLFLFVAFKASVEDSPYFMKASFKKKQKKKQMFKLIQVIHQITFLFLFFLK